MTNSTLTPQPQQTEKPPLFDRPIYKDWIVWLLAVAIFAAISGSVVGNYQQATGFAGTSEFNIQGQEMAFLIDCAIAAAFQFFLFGLLPANIRRGYRSGRAKG
jgi:hypothetical protein